MSQFFGQSKTELHKFGYSFRREIRRSSDDSYLRHCRVDVFLAFLMVYQEMCYSDDITATVTSKFKDSTAQCHVGRMWIYTADGIHYFFVYFDRYLSGFIRDRTFTIKKTNLGIKITLLFNTDEKDSSDRVKVEILIKYGYRQLDTYHDEIKILKHLNYLRTSMLWKDLDYDNFKHAINTLNCILDIVNPRKGNTSDEFGEQLAKCC